MPVCWPPFVKVQPVYWVSCPVFSHIIGWVPILFLYYCSFLYVSSFIECVILFLLALGCRNDIKKPSCLISCDWSSPSTGIADGSCCTKDNCDLFGARSPGQVGISCFTTSDSRANGPPINAGCDGGDGSLDSLFGLSDPGVRFVITTESVHCPHLPGFVRSDVESCHGRIEQILLNKFLPKEILPVLTYH